MTVVNSASWRSPLRSAANGGAVALVSGGGTGIGRAISLEWARTGARRVLCGRRAEPLEEVRAEIEATGGECLALAADVRETDHRAREARLPRLNRLYDCAVHGDVYAAGAVA